MSVEAPVYGYGFYSRRKRYSLFPGKRFIRWLGFLGLRDWPSALLTFATLGIAVYSVQQAKWIAPQPPLTLVLTLSMLVTALVLKTRLHPGLSLGLLTLAGGVVTAWQAVRLAGRESVWQALFSAPNQGTIHFGVFIVMVTWVAGALALWFVLRKRNAWIAATLGAIILVVNLSNLPEDYLKFFPMYLAAALILVGYTGLVNRPGWLHGNGAGHRKRGVFFSLALVVVISTVAVSAAWFMPDAGISRMGIGGSSQALADVQNNWLNIFASIPGKWSLIKNSDLQTLSFGAPLDNRDTVLFVVTSDQAAYWRIERYSDYHSWGWTNSPVSTGEVVKSGTKPDPELNALMSRQELTYTVETKSKTDVLLLPGEFVSSSIPVKLQEGVTESGMSAANGSDVVSVTTPYLLQPYQRYTVVASVSSATPAQLEQAGTAYPDWVTAGYLQLPSSLPLRVKQLAMATTRGAVTPYDEVAAIQQYLRGFKYDKNGKSPSRSGDEVDSFLFVQKEGVCTDFATAMVVMLRSVGVPARLATGYLASDHQAGTDTYAVRAKDYHAWPEVYFPGYGWIGFEATPQTGVSPALNIGGNNNSVSPDIPLEGFPVPDGGTVPPLAGGAPAKPKPGPALPIALTIVAVLVVTAVLWQIISRTYRSLRLSGDAEGVYAKMCRLASMVGIRPIFSETPLEYCRRLAAAFPDGAEAIGSIGRLYAEARFGARKELPQAELVRLQKSWVQLYPVLFKKRLPWNR